MLLVEGAKPLRPSQHPLYWPILGRDSREAEGAAYNAGWGWGWGEGGLNRFQEDRKHVKHICEHLEKDNCSLKSQINNNKIPQHTNNNASI